MAMLAAFDIQQAFGFRSLCVYTYGAPRVGNHIFASEYNDAVPNTWTVINDKVRQNLAIAMRIGLVSICIDCPAVLGVGAANIWSKSAKKLSFAMQDIVPTMPKFRFRALGIRISLFKRTGLRVHLSSDELITVRPSLMEARLGIVFSCATPAASCSRLHLIAMS